MELLQLSQHPLLECPACHGNQHSVHVDGNRKLYRFSKVHRYIHCIDSYYQLAQQILYRGIRRSYHEGLFIASNEEVARHLTAVGYKDESNVSFCVVFPMNFQIAICILLIKLSGLCGTTRWKAAKSSSKTMKNLDETGLIVTGCRHVIAQKAVNMFRGEL